MSMMITNNKRHMSNLQDWRSIQRVRNSRAMKAIIKKKKKKKKKKKQKVKRHRTSRKNQFMKNNLRNEEF